jgi:6,7-dimethyl-8-ribityllumazine synthase
VAEFRGTPVGTGRFAIIVSRFNENVTGRLLAGARACLTAHGVAEEAVDVIDVPGAWELPIAARMAADRGGYAGIIALGCVIQGETRHFDFVAGPAADGLARVALDSGIPVSTGLLTTDHLDQALARAGGRYGNKGWEAALASLELADLARRLGGDDA